MKKRMRLGYLGVCFNLSIVLVAFAPKLVWSQSLAEMPQRYIVVLDGESAASAFLKGKAAKAAAGPQAAAASGVVAARARAAQIKLEHDALASRITALGAKETTRHSKLLNAIVIKATASQANAIGQMPGVKNVRRVQLYEVNTASSVPFIGTTDVWGGSPAADGSGVRIGIIDTGIDYTHADFGGSGI